MASNPSEIEQNINLADSKHLAILKPILNLFLFLPENNASEYPYLLISPKMTIKYTSSSPCTDEKPQYFQFKHWILFSKLVENNTILIEKYQIETKSDQKHPQTHVVGTLTNSHRYDLETETVTSVNTSTLKTIDCTVFASSTHWLFKNTKDLGLKNGNGQTIDNQFQNA